MDDLPTTSTAEPVDVLPRQSDRSPDLAVTDAGLCEDADLGPTASPEEQREPDEDRRLAGSVLTVDLRERVLAAWRGAGSEFPDEPSRQSFARAQFVLELLEAVRAESWNTRGPRADRDAFEGLVDDAIDQVALLAVRAASS